MFNFAQENQDKSCFYHFSAVFDPKLSQELIFGIPSKLAALQMAKEGSIGP